uniref:Heat shock protein 70 n=1 Tax=Panagrolaimus davidi TaxID=227884 RepID=A0A914R3C1_9BILA
MEKPKAIGIDLGTTFSCVGVIQNGKCEIITNNQGEYTTPSVVGFIDGQRTVGEWPKKRTHKYPLNVISCIKRLIGRKFDDPNVQKDITNLPFKIVSKDGNAAVEIQFKGETRIYTPEEISAFILADIKNTAVKYLGGQSNDMIDAVITIPAYFNDAQKQATIDAAKIAKINVLRLINEPTAAALAYGFKQKWKNGTLLVYDLGGGTFDVSIIKVSDGCCEVLAVDGDDHLGGEDFDNIFFKYCIEEFQRKHKKDISNNARAICRLKAVCEDAKRRLSNDKFAPIEVENLFDGEDLNCKITVARFNELCKELIQKTLGPVKNVLEAAKLTKNDINNILLVGGSTRIPFIRTTLSEFFDGKNLNADINPDEAVANGATLLAANLSKSFDTSIQNIRLLDVIPRSIGLRVFRGQSDRVGYFQVSIPRNTKFPCVNKAEYPTLRDNQTAMKFEIYEGEYRLVKNNKLLGIFRLNNITRAPACVTKIDVTFEIDENGILTVTASEVGNENTNSITIQQNKGRLTENEIIKMVDEIYPPIMEIDLDDD